MVKTHEDINYVVLSVTISVLTCILQLIVMIMLRKERETHTNRHRIIWHFSFIEICISVLHVFFVPFHHSNYKTATYVLSCLEFIGLGATYFCMSLTIVVDRFLELYLSITYPVFISPLHLYAANGVYWLLGVTFSVILINFDEQRGKEILIAGFKYLYPILEGCILFLSLLVYTYISVKLLNNRIVPAHIRRLERLDRRRHRHRQYRKIARCTFITIVTAIGILPFTYYLCGHDNGILLMFYQFVFIKDGIVHILIQENVRAKIADVFKRKNKVDIKVHTQPGDPFVIFKHHLNSEHAKDSPTRNNKLGSTMITSEK